GAGVDARPRALEARRLDPRVKPAAVRPAGKEAEEERGVLAAAVQRDDLVDRQLRHGRDLREVGAVVARRDLDEAAGSHRESLGRHARKEITEPALRGLERDEPRIELED